MVIQNGSESMTHIADKKLCFEFTDQQVQNLKALIMDANIKGAVAPVIVELLKVLENPVVENEEDDLHRKHHDSEGHGTDGPQDDQDSCH